MNIEIDLETIALDKNQIFGHLYFQEDDFFFPSKDWNEFIVIVLNWWCESLISLLENKALIGELDFMDGPFSVKVNFIEESIFNLFFKKNNEILYSYQVNSLKFTKEFLKQVNALLRNIKGLDEANNRDVEKLIKNYKTLRLTLKKIICRIN